MSYINRNLEGKKCFVITPLGENDSETRKKAESIIGNIIEPVVKDKLKLDMILPHRISASGDINNQIIEHLLSDDLVIANLSELNPNVMYELGIRHSAKKHTITLAEIETQLPFDVKTARTIFYSNEPHKFSETKIQLEEAIIENMDLPEKDINNPVYSFYDGKVLKDFIGDNASDVAGVIKEIHKNVDYLIESTDFKNFTYKHAYKGRIVYQAGLSGHYLALNVDL